MQTSLRVFLYRGSTKYIILVTYTNIYTSEINESSGQGKKRLRGTRGPTGGIANRGEGVAVNGGRAVLPQCFEMAGRAVAFVAGAGRLGGYGGPHPPARVPMRFCRGRGGPPGGSAGIALYK